jgi:hypothetical protein
VSFSSALEDRDKREADGKCSAQDTGDSQRSGANQRRGGGGEGLSRTECQDGK